MSKKWGTWAAAVEEAEAEEREAQAAAASAGGTGLVGESQNFPSLKEAVSAKPKKKKMSLMEFNTGGYSGAGGFAREQRGLTPDEMMRLPTGPKERSAEEMQSNRLGGGFNNYGGGRSGGLPRDRGDGDGSWAGGRRSYGEFDDERRGGPRSRVSDFDQPSRADEVDNWASVKKPMPAFDSGRQNRYGSLGGGGGNGFDSGKQNRYGSLGGGGDGYGGSRADGVDNWMSGKKPLPSRSPAFGPGFRDSGPESDRWTRGTRDGDRERPRLVLDQPRNDAAAYETEAKTDNSNKPNPFGAARPREVVLAEKGLDWKKLESDIEAKKESGPTSENSSSRPSSAQSSRSEGLQAVEVKARPKINPFGDAKPREVLLEERGQDWRKIDLDLERRRVERPETVEEKLLREEIDNLKKELEKDPAVNSNKESGDEAGGQTSLQDILNQKERELEILTRDLDEKVRFGQKERPGSAAGKTPGFPDRPASQSGSFDDSRSVEFADRPQSRGTGVEFADRPRSRGTGVEYADRSRSRITGDPRMRSNEERRPFQGSRDRGWFQNSRDSDRSSSGDKW